MEEKDWHSASLRSLQVLISGEAGSRFLSETGQQEPDDTFLFILHAEPRRRRFTIPSSQPGSWKLEIASGKPNRRRDHVHLTSRSFALYRLERS